MIMAKKDIDSFNSRFDKVIEGLTEIKIETAGIKEHLKTLNGKVASHEQRFTDVYQEFKTMSIGRTSCQDNIRLELEKIRNKNELDNKEQDEETKKIDTKLWEIRIQLVIIAVVVATASNMGLKLLGF
jgi:predicted nuclease with TOPRIM domain